MNTEVKKTALDVIREKSEQIGYGEWHIKLIIYNGEVMGFDQIESPLIKYRASHGKKVE